MQTIIINNEAEMLALGEKLAKMVKPGMVIFLQGQLGAGKTTFTRGFLHGLGHVGKVKSPTYTLVESYQLSEVEVHHFDLYRLLDPEELALMGFRDYFHQHSIVLIEWPEKAGGFLPTASINLSIVILAANVRQIIINSNASLNIKI